MRVIIPKITLPKLRRKKTGSVWRVLKRLDDGRFLIVGKVERYKTYNGGRV